MVLRERRHFLRWKRDASFFDDSLPLRVIQYPILLLTSKCFLFWRVTSLVKGGREGPVSFFVIIIFNKISDETVVWKLFEAAGYTYGPILGLFMFGLFTKLKVKDRFTWLVCLISPILCVLLKMYLIEYHDYKVGFELLLINGLFTFMGLLVIQEKK